MGEQSCIIEIPLLQIFTEEMVLLQQEISQKWIVYFDCQVLLHICPKFCRQYKDGQSFPGVQH